METRLARALVLMLTVTALFSGRALAQQSERSQHARINYVVTIITSGVDHFWQANGRMPYSMDELYQAGMLPKNLRNPITGNDLDLYAQSPAVGEFVYTWSDEQHATFLFTDADNSTSEVPIDVSHDSVTTIPQPDFVLSLYQTWGVLALQTYYMVTKQIPTSLSDLQDAGYWPFTDEKNPITGENLDFYTDKPGNIAFRFRADRVYVYACTSDGGNTIALLDPAQQTWLQD